MMGGAVGTASRSPYPRSNPPTGGGTKLFVGGLPDISTDEMRAYFEAHGTVSDAIVMVRDGIPRGFGFVTFADDATAQLVLNTNHVIKGKSVELKMADGKRGGGGGGGYGCGQSCGMMGPGTMAPEVGGGAQARAFP